MHCPAKWLGAWSHHPGVMSPHCGLGPGSQLLHIPSPVGGREPCSPTSPPSSLASLPLSFSDPKPSEPLAFMVAREPGRRGPAPPTGHEVVCLATGHTDTHTLMPGSCNTVPSTRWGAQSGWPLWEATLGRPVLKQQQQQTGICLFLVHLRWARSLSSCFPVS